MKFAEYAPLARRTLKVLDTVPQHLSHMSMGIVGEYGELVDALKKHAIYGKPLDHTNCVEEVGDISWYLANMCEELKINPASIDEAFAEVGQETIPARVSVFETADALLACAAVSSSICCEALSTNTPNAPETVGGLAGLLAVTCVLLEVNIEEALDKNIAKLAARYGDKYSDYSALNRDLGAERKVLESVPDAGSVASEGSDSIAGEAGRPMHHPG